MIQLIIHYNDGKKVVCPRNITAVAICDWKRDDIPILHAPVTYDNAYSDDIKLDHEKVKKIELVLQGKEVAKSST